MPGSRMVRRFMLIRLVTISGLLFLAGVVALLFFAKIEEQVVAYGVVEPQDATEIRGKRPTIVSAVLVEPGQVVAKGDVLFKTSSSRVRNDLERAKDQLMKAQASLAVQKARLERLKKDPLPENLRCAQDEVEFARRAVELAQREVARMKSLAKDGLVAQAQVDVALAKLDSAQKQYRLAQRRVQLVKAGLKDAIIQEAVAQVALTEREIVNLQHEVKRWEKELQKCVFKAPVAGRVVGVYKKEGEQVLPGELLATIAQSNRTQLKLMVREQDIYKVGLGQLARIYSSVYSYRKYGTCEGEVAEVSPSAEPGKNKAVYEVTVSVTDAPFPLLLGSTAQARIVVARRGILDLLLDRG